MVSVPMTRTRLSVCIPAYNRSQYLSSLLDSIFDQTYQDFEIIICEDDSPERVHIRAVIETYAKKYPCVIKYIENETNLGYDGNLRKLLNIASGEYCLLLGNDDLLAPNALAVVAAAVTRHPNIGVLLRSYATFDGTPDNIVQTCRYFDKERIFSAGEETVATFFRRSVVISGLVIHRDSAEKYATEEFDGNLLYQLYLIARILLEMDGLFSPEILAYYRLGGVPDFGNNINERGKYIPRQITPNSSLEFISGMLKIAAHVEANQEVAIYHKILHDIGNYSYPILAIQARLPLFHFLKYCLNLSKLGLWQNGLFFIYIVSLLTLGTRGSNWLIQFIKAKYGHTPVLGRVFTGRTL